MYRWLGTDREIVAKPIAVGPGPDKICHPVAGIPRLLPVGLLKAVHPATKPGFLLYSAELCAKCPRWLKTESFLIASLFAMRWKQARSAQGFRSTESFRRFRSTISNCLLQAVSRQEIEFSVHSIRATLLQRCGIATLCPTLFPCLPTSSTTSPS